MPLDLSRICSADGTCTIARDDLERIAAANIILAMRLKLTDDALRQCEGRRGA